MELESAFISFLKEIRPTDNQKDDLKKGHKTLRDRLNADENLKQYIVSDFLQGSYRRATAVRPKGDKRSDVDIIVVTNIAEDKFPKPSKAMDLFTAFLDEHYKGKWRAQNRSFGIELSYVDMDLVITSAPSETTEDMLKSESVRSDDSIEDASDWRFNKDWIALNSRASRYDAIEVLAKSEKEAEWKADPLRIPDRKVEKWEDTHPLEQIKWTRDKNKNTEGHFVNVVKAIKWWRLTHFEDARPKGFPLERIIGECCPDDIFSVAEGVTRTLEKITSDFKSYYDGKSKPFLADYGVPSHDVLKSLEISDFLKFYEDVKTVSAKARKALDSSSKKESHDIWREIFGTKFPEAPKDDTSKKTGFTEPEGPANPSSNRFA